MDRKQFHSEQITLESKDLAMCRAEMHRIYSVEGGEAGTSETVCLTSVFYCKYFEGPKNGVMAGDSDPF